MSMSEDDLEEAQNILKDLESRCSQNTGWLSAIKSKMFGYYEVRIADNSTHSKILIYSPYRLDFNLYVGTSWIGI